MIIDCFMFFQEYDIVEGRLEYLYDTVDYFIIVEGNITHSGKPKPLNFLENKSRYKKYLDKILYLPWTYNVSNLNLDYKPNSLDLSSPHWVIEHAQRDHISEGLKFFPDDAFVMISDADEIPFKEKILGCCDILNRGETEFITLRQDMFVNNFKNLSNSPWLGTVIGKNKSARQRTPQWMRDYRSAFSSWWSAGYHLSYWGDAESIAYKISNFAHQEYNNPNYTDVNAITSKLSQGIDLFGRESLVQFNPDDVRPDIKNIFEKYRNDRK